MKTTKLLLLLGSLLPGALMPFAAHADINIAPQNPVYDPTSFGNAGGYQFNNLLLQDTTISSTPQVIDIPLSTSITLTSLGSGYNYGFGMSGLNPAIPYGVEAFSFYIQLFKGKNPITPDFSYLIANPFTFGFTLINPFDPDNFPGVSPVGNLYTGYNTPNSLGSPLTFDKIKIQVSNNAQVTGVTDFSVSLGVNGPPVVPEPSTYIAGALMLLPFGLSTLRMLRKNRTP